MIPITPERYLTTIWNSYFKGRRLHAVRLDLGADLFQAFKRDIVVLTREVPEDYPVPPEPVPLAFKTGRIYDSGTPGWDVRISLLNL